MIRFDRHGLHKIRIGKPPDVPDWTRINIGIMTRAGARSALAFLITPCWFSNFPAQQQTGSGTSIYNHI
jgi:hypothetical protein